MIEKIYMTKRYSWIMTLMALTLLTASVAKAQDDANLQASASSLRDGRDLADASRRSEAKTEGGLGVGFTLDYFTKYIWRGQNLNNESVFQPSVYLSKYGFTATIWSTQDWTNVNGEGGDFTEVDYSLEYTNTTSFFDGIDWLAGVIRYDYTVGDTEDTTEVYGGLALSKLLLAPSFKFYRDVDDIKGAYYQFGLGHTIEKITQWRHDCYCDLAFGASVGFGNSAYNKGNFDVSDRKFNDLTLSLALPVCWGDCWSITPSINYSTMLAGAVRDATDKSDNLWFGISLSADF